MNSNEFMGMLIIAIIALIGLGTAIITPILKLNKNITELNVNIKNLNARAEEDRKTISKLDDKIDNVQSTVKDHDVRIVFLEKGVYCKK